MKSIWTWISLAALTLVACAACQSSSGVPTQGTTHVFHATDGVPVDQRVDLWVSYQITVAEIDGERTDYRPEAPCLYWRLTLPAGDHELGLRLDYDSMTHSIETEGVLRQGFRLQARGEYRLLDLNAGTTGERVFRPWLLEGAPEDERIDLRRPASGA